MTESWCPQAGDGVECVSNEYGQHEQRPEPGMKGKVLKVVDDGEGHRLLVIQFLRKENSAYPHKLLKKLFIGREDKPVDSFREYFDISRKPYLYFKPTNETILGK